MTLSAAALSQQFCSVLLHGKAQPHGTRLAFQKPDHWAVKLSPSLPFTWWLASCLLLASHKFLQRKHLHKQQDAENTFQENFVRIQEHEFLC